MRQLLETVYLRRFPYNLLMANISPPLPLVGGRTGSSGAVFYRKDGRATDQLRPLTLTPDFVRTAEGSVLISVEHTRVLVQCHDRERCAGVAAQLGPGLGHG